MHCIYKIKFWDIVFTPFAFSAQLALIPSCISHLHHQHHQHMMIWFAVSAKAYVVVSCRKPYYTSPQGRLERTNPSNSKKIGAISIPLNIMFLHCFYSVSADPAVRELEWYLRDHLFRQSNAGKTSFRRELLPHEMTSLYLRYRNSDLDQLSNIMTSVIEILTTRKVVRQDSNELKLLGRMTRLQCIKCFYINYLTEVESRACLRCQHSELQDFPKKKA